MYKSIVLTLLLFTSFLLAQEKNENKDAEIPSWFLNSFLDLSDDIENLAQDNKRLIIFIHQNGCPYCKEFITKNLNDKKTKEKILKNFGMIDINMFGNKEVTDIDNEIFNEKEFAKKYKIQFTPTLIFFNENKKQILRLNGYINIKKFNTALDYVKNKREDLLTYKEYLIDENKNKNTEKLIDEPDLFTKSKNFMRSNNSKKIAIFFESKNCEECKILHNKLLKNTTTRNYLKQMDVYQIDMNSSKSIVTPKKMITKIKKWTKDLNITNTPTIIFFDEKGKEIIRIESSFKNFHFQTVVHYVVSNAYKKEKEFQRFLTQRVKTIKEKGLSAEMWE